VIDLVADSVDVAGRELSILRPPDAEALLDEEAFDREEFLPYWAELWPSGLALAREVAARPVAGLRVVELGCGLGLPSIAAAIAGAHVLATDWSPDAIELLRRNADRNGAELDVLACSWAAPSPLVERGPFGLVLAADVLYERRNVDQLLTLLPQLVTTGEVVLADPGRPHLKTFLDAAAASWEITAQPRPQEGAAKLALHRLRRQA
jgi:predicted nicotinamide N-methyase